MTENPRDGSDRQWRTARGAGNVRYHRRNQFVFSAPMDSSGKNFVAELEEYARREKIPVVQFRKGNARTIKFWAAGSHVFFRISSRERRPPTLLR